MKRIIFALVCTFALIALAACQSDTAADISAPDAAEAMRQSQPDPSVFTETLTPEDGAYEYASDVYGINPELLSDAAVMRADGMEPHEIAVLKASGEENVISHALHEYIDSRYNDFSGYAPDAAAIVGSAEVISYKDGCVLLLICDDTSAAKNAFETCLDAPAEENGSGQETPETEEPHLDENGYVVFDASGLKDMPVYDDSAILQSFKTGDMSALGEKDKAILEAAVRVLSETVTEDMSDFEKEHAVHDYMITHASYDEDAIEGHADPDSVNPYGLLINGKATCMGYSTTFSLFMDMLGIENTIVSGAHGYSTEEHAWNMVRLSDEWYCVDVTWDDPIGSPFTKQNIHDDRYMMNAAHKYFNVTSEFMRDTDHQWDYYNVPEAEGTKFAFDEFN